MKKTLWSTLIVCLLSWTLASQAKAKKYKIKLATLAPKGSSWMNVFQQMKWEVKKKTNGQLILKMYAGGRMGDEKVVVGKMKLGKIHGAALTTVGLGQINKAIFSLQLPFLFKNYKALDYVRTKLDKHFRQMFLQKGFVLLGWADVGYVYIYSKRKLQTIDDMKKAKIWAWTDDPLSQKFSTLAGFTPRLLSLLNVRNGLQTGIVDTIISTPLTLIAMQWHTYVKYRVRYKFAIAIGATVLRKATWDKLPPKFQKILMETSLKYHKKLNEIIRRDNLRARYTLKRLGIKGLRISKAQRKLIRKLGRKVYEAFIGKLYSADDLKKVEDAIREYKKKKQK